MMSSIHSLSLVHTISSIQVFAASTLSALLLFAVVWAVRRTYARKEERPPPKKGTRNQPDLREADLSQVVPADYEWRTKAAISYRPWHNGPYHVTMRIKSVSMADWIEVDETYLWKYQLKKKLYEQHRDEVLQILHGCEEGQLEALYLLKDVLVKRYPTMFVARSEHKIENLVTGDVWDIHQDSPTWEKYNPLEVMGLLATEDFFVLQVDEQTGQTTLKAAASCFPAGFKIEERVGKTLWGIHAGKVPQYETKLAKSMDRFFQKLRVDSPIQRFNYAIDDSDELFHRHSHHNLAEDAEREKPVALEDLHLRVERQVLQRLSNTRDILFSIRTYVTPITEVTQDAEVARALRTSVNSYTDDVAKYKNKELWNDVLQRHLRERLRENEPIS